MSQVFPVLPNLAMILLFTGLIVLLVSILGRLVWSKRLKRAKLFIYILAPLLAIFTLLLAGSYMTNVTVDAEKVAVTVPIAFTTKVVEKSDVARVFIVDWDSDEAYRPNLRNFGAALFEYKVGWFTLSNGRSALLLTSSSANLAIETKGGELILVSPQDFDEFVAFFEKVFLRVEKMEP